MSYLDSRRIVGTNAQRVGDATELQSGVAGWKELGRTTLGSSATSYEVASLANKRYLMVLVNNINAGQVEGDSLRFNNDTTANQHAGRYNNNGGSDGTIVNKTKTNMFGFHPHTQPSFAVMNVANLSSKEKLAIIHSVGHSSNVSGSGNAPDRAEMVAKYVNTSNPISSIQQVTNWSTYNSGSEMVVLGYDPADTHTTNFWEELASVNGDGSSAVLDSSTFTSKKYIWVQVFVDAPTSVNIVTQVGNSTIDTGSNYSYRSSGNGAADATATGASWLALDAGSPTVPSFMNMFIINNSSNEKLFMINQVDGNTAGAGTAPDRRETVGKWSNTSNQINRIEIENQSATNFTSSSILKVWGAD